MESCLSRSKLLGRDYTELKKSLTCLIETVCDYARAKVGTMQV